MFLEHKERKERLDHKNNRSKINKETDMYCKKCDGTGLSNLFIVDGKLQGWDGISYCDICEGYGSIDWVNFIIKGFRFDQFTYGKVITNRK